MAKCTFIVAFRTKCAKCSFGAQHERAIMLLNHVSEQSVLAMEKLETDKILLGIYKEQKSIFKFIDAIFEFLKRNTNFHLIPASERVRLQQSLYDALSLCDSDQKSPTCLERVFVECAPLAASEIEIETESGNVGSEFDWDYLVPVSESSKEHIVTDLKMSDAVNIYFEHSEVENTTSTSKSQKQTCCLDIKKYRRILPKPDSEQVNIMPEISPTNPEVLTTNRRRVYKCSECSLIFNSFRQLKVHEALHSCQADFGISICIYCCSLYANVETLEKHISDCHMTGRYLCVPCAKTYKSRGQLLKHVHSSAHNASALLYYCSLCPRSEKSHVEFPSRTSLQQHYQETHLLMPANQGEDDVEIEMNEEFLDEFLLHNVNENSFNFSECWDALDLNLPDMLHLANAVENGSHAKDNIDQSLGFAFKCPICFEGLSNQKLLLQHIAHKHGLQVLICNKCDSTFKDYTQWIHHKRTHRVQLGVQNVGAEERKCEICDKIFRSNAALNYHVKTHLRSFLQAPHECPYCQKHFHSDTNLKQHIRIVHSLTKRHKCVLCDKPFTTLDHLKKHVLSQHQNERKHICHICAKSFTQLCHLKQHLAIHTTGKSHQCMKCKETFWRKIDLQRHMHKKH